MIFLFLYIPTYSKSWQTYQRVVAAWMELIDEPTSYWPSKPLRLPTFAPASKAFMTGQMPSTNYARPKNVACRGPIGGLEIFKLDGSQFGLWNINFLAWSCSIAPARKPRNGWKRKSPNWTRRNWVEICKRFRPCSEGTRTSNENWHRSRKGSIE